MGATSCSYEAAEFTIIVFIPSPAQDGEQDGMTVRVSSRASSMVSVTTEMTTLALYQRLPRLTPSEARHIGNIGGMLEYHLTLWNFSVVADTIDLAVISDWMVELPFTSYTLASYENVGLTIKVFIPGVGIEGDVDTAFIIASSLVDALASDTTSLFTYAGIGRKYLPLIEK